MAVFTLLICMFVMINPCRGQCLRKLGPSEYEFESIEECSDPGDHEIRFTPKITRDPRDCSVRKLCHSLSVSLQFDLNNEYEISVGYHCQDSVGHWQKLGFPDKGIKMCSDSSNWMDLIQKRTHAAVRCPIPKGNYSFECENLELFNMNRWVQRGDHNETLMFYGKYKVDQIYFRNHRKGPAQMENINYAECSNTGDHEIVIDTMVSRNPNNCNVRKICVSLNVSLEYDLNDDYEIEKTTYCKDTIGLWKYHQSHPRVKACKIPSFWMYDIQTLTNATHACPLPKGNYSFDCQKHKRPVRKIYGKLPEDHIDFYGRFKTIKKYFRKGRLVGCTVSREKVYPRPTV